MPIFEYKCNDCGQVTEYLEKQKDHKNIFAKNVTALTCKNFYPALLLVKANLQIKPVSRAQAAHAQQAPVRMVSVHIRSFLDFFNSEI